MPADLINLTSAMPPFHLEEQTPSSTEQSDHVTLPPSYPEQTTTRPPLQPLPSNIQRGINAGIDATIGTHLDQLDEVVEDTHALRAAELRRAEDAIAHLIQDWRPDVTQRRLNFERTFLTTHVKAFYSESIGVFILNLFGCLGGIKFAQLTGSIAIGWGIGVWLAQYVADEFSGAHLNPIVTLYLFLFTDYKWHMAVVVLAAQHLAAPAAFALGFWLLKPIVESTVEEFGAKGGAELIAPLPDMSDPARLTSVEVVACNLIVFIVLFSSAKIRKVKRLTRYTIIAITVTSVIYFFDTVCLNPATEFGRRIFAIIVYGQEAITSYSFIAYLAPFLGMLIAGAFFGMFFADYTRMVEEGFAREAGQQPLHNELPTRARVIPQVIAKVHSWSTASSRTEVEPADLESGTVTRRPSGASYKMDKLTQPMTT